MTSRATVVASELRRTSTKARLLRGLFVSAIVAPLALLVPVAPGVAGAKGSPVVKEAKRGNLGTILVTARGKALYKFASDKPNKPTCSGTCAALWPPLLVPANDKTPVGGPGVSGLGSVKVAGNKRQVTYHKAPLYTFASDSGTAVTGNGEGGFSVIHPGKSATAAASTPTTSGGGY